MFGKLAHHIRYTSGAPTAIMFGKVVHVFGASDARAESVLRGFTCAGVYVDELTVIAYEFFAQLLNRLWLKAQLFGTTNPDAPTHWLPEKYLDRFDELPNWSKWKFTLDDNPALTEEAKENIRRENVGLFYERFVLGNWVAAEGAVYPMWDKTVHVVTEMPRMERVIGCGLDYGDDHLTRGYLLGVGRREGEPYKLWILAEWAPGAMTIGEHSAHLRRWLASHHDPMWRTPEWIAVDPAAASFKRQLRVDGLTVMNAHNRVVPGIQVMSALLATGKMLVSHTCTELIRKLPGYLWNEKSSITEPLKKDDDEVDALRYTVYSTRRFWDHLVPLTVDINDLEEVAA